MAELLRANDEKLEFEKRLHDKMSKYIRVHENLYDMKKRPASHVSSTAAATAAGTGTGTGTDSKILDQDTSSDKKDNKTVKSDKEIVNEEVIDEVIEKMVQISNTLDGLQSMSATSLQVIYSFILKRGFYDLSLNFYWSKTPIK